MHIRRFDFDFGRRHFLRSSFAAGVTAPLWPKLAVSGQIDQAYPEELLDIEAFTRGRIKPGDIIDRDNVDLVQDLIDPVILQEVRQDKRTFFIQDADHNIESLFPPYFLDATIRHQGMARFDSAGNVVASDGSPWVGGLPFPAAATGNEVIANMTLSWGRHDKAIYAFPAVVIGPEGNQQYEYDFVWVEQQCTGLVHPDRPAQHLPDYEDKTRLQTIFFTHTNDVKGSAFLSIWPYDQRRIPDLFGYLPNLKRVRRYPANQRFEPYMPGLNLYLSDAWAAGDPMLTWGNYRIIYRGPYLGSAHAQWRPNEKNWSHPLVGGGEGKSYWNVGKSLIPEVIVFESEPVGYPRAPVSKRRVYVDARNMSVLQALSYDRDGNLWKSFESGSGQRQFDGIIETSSDGRPEWSFNWLISHDIQENRVTRVLQARTCRGEWRTQLDPKTDIVNRFMTERALRRLGT